MIFDTHIHCDFSCDSRLRLEEACAVAKQKNIGIIITEHMDLHYPTNPLAFVFDIAEYFKSGNAYRNEQVLLGIELGLQTTCHQENEAVLKQGNFDMVIGSIHVAKQIDVYMERFYEGFSKQQSYQRYLEDMLACVQQFKNYDTLGHIDYICRYAPYEDTNLELAVHRELWAAIFSQLIADGKALELNTRRLDEPLARASLQPLYKLYYDLGGRYVTLGSDAHAQAEVGRRICLADTWVRDLALQPVYFKERQMFKASQA